MTEQQWRYHTPERDGHAPDDWDASMEWDCPAYNSGAFVKDSFSSAPQWWEGETYRYRPLQDATVEPSFDTLKDQCLALPQDQREALIEAMQKPQRDWADEVADAVALEWRAARFTGETGKAAAVIRSMCRPKEGQFK